MNKNEVIEKAHELFIHYGIKSITMDELARELGVSKKTLYELVKDKHEVVSLVTKKHLEKEKVDFIEIKEDSIDALDQLVKFSRCMRNNLRDINPTLLFDLKRYHREAWIKWDDFKRKFIAEEVKNNMLRGISEGLFRENLNVDLLSLMRMHQVEVAFDTKIFPRDQFDFRETQIEMLNHFIYGIVTVKGRKLFEKYLKELNKV